MGQCNSNSEAKDLEHQTCLLEESAESFLQNNDYTRALNFFHKAIDFYHKNDSIYSDKVVKIYFRIVHIYEVQLMLKESLYYYEKIFEIYSTLYGVNSPKAQEVCSTLAKRSYFNHDYEKAAQFYSILLRNVIDDRDTPSAEAGSIHDKLGEIYRELHDYTQSALHYGRALECLKRSKTVDTDTLAVEYNRLGRVFLDHLNEYEAAVECFENRIVLLKSTQGEIHEDISISYLDLATAKAKMKQFHLAQLDLIKSINIAIEAEWNLEQSRFETLVNTFNLLSAVYEAQGKIKESLETDKSWCKLMLKDDEINPYYEAYFIRMYGDACFELEDYEQAAKTYFEVVEILQNLPEIEIDMSKTLLKLGIAYSKIDDHRSNDCLREAMLCQLKAGNSLNETILQIKKQQALNKSQKGRHVDALNDLNLVLNDYNKLYKNPLHISLVDLRVCFGKVYKEMGRLESAYDSVTQALGERNDPKLTYLLEGETKYEIGGLIYQLPDLTNKFDLKSKIFKKMLKRLTTKGEIVGRIRLIPSAESISKQLDEIC